jgi:hypothetical protein
LTRSCAWLGAAFLAIGCRYVVSFDDFASGSGSSETAAGRGGSSAGSNGGNAGALGGAGTGQGGTGLDGSVDVFDAPPDRPPRMPITIYKPQAGATVRGITVDATYIYWAEGGPGRGIFRMPKLGGMADVVLMHGPSLSAYDVAVDSTSIYWSDGDYFVWAMPRDGDATSPKTQWFAHNSTLSPPRYVTVDDKQIVYVSINGDTTNGSIVSGSRSGSLHPYSGQSGIAGIAFRGVPDAGERLILWGHSMGIREGVITGGGTGDDLFTGTADPVAGVATDGVEMVWISHDQIIKKGRFAPTPSANDTGCISPPQDLGANADIALDDQWIYFTWPSKNEIDKCPRY